MKFILLLLLLLTTSVNATMLTSEQTKSLGSIFVYPIDTTNYQCEALSQRGLQDYQIKNMYISFQYGRERNLSYSLAAISFHESSAGNPRFMRNPNDPSAGYHGVTLINVMRLLGMQDTYTNRAIVEDMLINSHGASAWFSMTILEWWLNYHKGDYFKAYRSYNGGFYWRTRHSNKQLVLERTWRYAANIENTIRTIKKCNWD